MFEKLKKTIDSLWARSKVFKIIIITAFFLFMALAIFLLTVYVRILLGISFSILFIIIPDWSSDMSLAKRDMWRRPKSFHQSIIPTNVGWSA